VKRVCLAFSCFLLLAVLCISEAPHTLAANELEENSWSVLPEDEKKQFLQCAAVNGKIYAFCFNRQMHSIDVHIYDPSANVWETKISYLDFIPRGGEFPPFTTAVVGGSIYFFGYGYFGGDGLLDNKVYDTKTNHWSSITPSQYFRYSPSACTVNDKIYVIGGAFLEAYPVYLSPVREETNTNLVETYNPSTGTWETKQSMNKPVQSPISIVIKDEIYVFGGGYIQIYDTQASQWRILKEYDGDTRYIVGGATTGKHAPQRIYLLGQDAVHVFDPETKNFSDSINYPVYTSSQYPNVTFRNYQTSEVAVVDDVFYLTGGGVTGTLEKQWVTSEGKIKKSSEPVSFGVDYCFVPLGYSASVHSDSGAGVGGGFLVFTVAGLLVACVVVAVVGLIVYRFRHVSAEAKLS
jgi:N-acetylneuraminic acid mutarotase